MGQPETAVQHASAATASQFSQALRGLLAFPLALAACSAPAPTSSSDDAGAREAAPTVPPVEPRTPGDSVEHTLRFVRARAHYVAVESVFPTGGAPTIDISMATWTPGSYLVREYSRNIEELTASNVGGEVLPATKTAKNRWNIDTKGADRVVVRYDLYARELSVRTNFVDESLAVLNGAPTFFRLVDGGPARHDVLFELPSGWKDSVTSLPAHPDKRPHHYTADSYDTLADSPVALGTPAIYTFDVDGVSHRLANFNEGGVWDGERSAKDVETLVNTQVDFWKSIPYQQYTFLNILEEGGGGLEHKASTLMLASKWMTRTRKSYIRWLGLVSHEFFHTWNVKRLRPVALGPFDYEQENYTRSLWIAEGITSYYDNLLLVRAGLLNEKEFLEQLSAEIKTLQTTPGRKVQSLAEASFDAWIKYYRPSENSENTTISYYTKGAVVAFLLDTTIRERSGGRASLDDVMRSAYKRFSGDKGYTPEEFRAVVDQVTGKPMGDFFARYVDGTEELDYDSALAYLGLRFARPADDKEDEIAGWLGASFTHNKVSTVPRATPAFEAGVNAGDELLGIGDYQVTAPIDEHLKRYRPGEKVELLVARRGKLLRLPVTLGQEPNADRWTLELAPGANPVTRARRTSWLGL